MSLSRVTEWVETRDREAYLADVPVELYPIVLLATVLRTFRLEAESYWLDEAFSVDLVTSKTVAELLFGMPGNEPHPPLYNLLLYGWTSVFGTSELATRLLSALLGIATVVALYGVGRRFFDRRIGAIAALLLAVSPFHIWYSQETRMYSLLALLTAASFYSFLGLHANESTDDLPIGDDLGYVLSTVLLGYAHVFGLFAILAQNLYVCSQYVVGTVPRSRLTVRRWITLEGLTALLLAPWLVRLLERVVAAQRGDAGNVSWIPTPTAETVRDTFGAYLGGYLFGESFPILVAGLVTVCAVVALSGGDTSASESGPDAPINGTYLVVLWLVTPILVPILLSYVVTPVFVTRYSIGASLAFFLLIAKGVRTFSRPSLQYVLLGLLVAGLVLPLPTYYEADQKEQWREAATRVETGVDGDDVVLVSQPWTRRPFEFYFDRPNVPVVRVTPDASASEVRHSIRGRDDAWVVLSYTGESTERRILQAISDHPGYRGPVASAGYIGVEVHRFERTSLDTGSNESRRGDTNRLGPRRLPSSASATLSPFRKAEISPHRSVGR